MLHFQFLNHLKGAPSSIQKVYLSCPLQFLTISGNNVFLHFCLFYMVRNDKHVLKMGNFIFPKATT